MTSAHRPPAVFLGFLSVTDAPASTVDRRSVHLLADCRYIPACVAVEEVELVGARSRESEAGSEHGRVDAEVVGHGWRPVCRRCARRTGVLRGAQR